VTCSRTSAFSLALAVVCACGQGSFAEGSLPGEVPGQDPWTDPGDPTAPDMRCLRDADCAGGETCAAGICQMKRCTQGPYSSRAPIGESFFFAFDREVIVADTSPYQGTYWLDGYAPDGDGYTGSWDFGGGELADVAGGNFFGARPEALAAAVTGQQWVSVQHGDQALALDIGFEPAGLASGDIDRDQTDELVAVSATGRLAVCKPAAESCERFTLSGATVGLDVTVADVDGDRFEEIVLLLEVGGEPTLYVWNADAAVTGQEAAISAPAGHALVRLTAGDIDGDGRAELLGLEEGGYMGFADDAVFAYRAPGGTIVESGTLEVDGDSVDVASGDFDMDGTAELAIVRSDGEMELVSGDGGALYSRGASPLGVTTSPKRVALADIDGDSPRGRLVGEPELVAGNVVPTMVLNLPPYDSEHSRGVPSLYVGNTGDTSESLSDSVSLRLGVELGYEASVFGLFDAGVSAELGREVSTSHSLSKSMSVGERYAFTAEPEIYGDEYSAVVLSCGCFHGYTYELDDPTEKLGPNGGKFVLLVPVGGQTTLWSSQRYNAMAAALGTLPLVEPVGRMGRPDEYPSAPELPDGGPIQSRDIIFPSPPQLQVSDVGNVGFWLSASQSEANETAQTTSLGASAHVTMAGFNVGVSAGTSFGSSYSVSVGREAVFGGDVPAVPDDPSTPEDEYELYRYTFSPWVYRRHYTDVAGNDAAYYVLGYTVGR
jgi:hypothetical protein